MSLRIPIHFLYRLHHYTIQFMPNEVFALLIGARQAGDIYITDYVHPVLLDASPGHVRVDLDDVFYKAEKYYTVGFVHTHPGAGSSVNQSDADRSFHEAMMEHFVKQFHRRAYFMIYAPCPGIFALYDGTAPFEDYVVLSGQAFPRSSSD